MAICGLSLDWNRHNIFNFRTDRSDLFKKAQPGTCWGHHFIFLKASWLHSKSTGINVINNYGLPRFDISLFELSWCPSPFLPASVSLCHGNVLASQNTQWQPGGDGGWVVWGMDRSLKECLLFKYIFGLGFKTGGLKELPANKWIRKCILWGLTLCCLLIFWHKKRRWVCGMHTSNTQWNMPIWGKPLGPGEVADGWYLCLPRIVHIQLSPERDWMRSCRTSQSHRVSWLSQLAHLGAEVTVTFLFFAPVLLKMLESSCLT